MFFKKKNAALPSVCIKSKGTVLYEGLLKDIPLKEAVILEKSVHFFDDPEPCYIHRNAVRMRLTQELHQELLSKNNTDTTPGSLLLSYTDLDAPDSCQLF